MGTIPRIEQLPNLYFHTNQLEIVDKDKINGFVWITFKHKESKDNNVQSAIIRVSKLEDSILYNHSATELTVPDSFNDGVPCSIDEYWGVGLVTDQDLKNLLSEELKYALLTVEQFAMLTEQQKKWYYDLCISENLEIGWIEEMKRYIVKDRRLDTFYNNDIVFQFARNIRMAAHAA